MEPTARMADEDRLADRESRETTLPFTHPAAEPSLDDPVNAPLQASAKTPVETSAEQPAGKASVLPQGAEQPRQIGRYRVEKLLGRGGFGLVFLAYDSELHRPVAIKVPHKKRLLNRAVADEYVKEARTVADLDHPHIVPVYDVGHTEDYPCYIVSKYIEGADLADKIRHGRFTHADAANLVATVSETLHYAHKRGLVHRDVKPANILIDRDGKPYVVDFGVALRDEDVGRVDPYAGTIAYMSPEQARGEGHRVDGRSDVYSLGAVLYELLTGRRTVSGHTETTEILSEIALQEPKPPRQINDAVPKELERICLKSLAKRASERYTTALDLAQDLRAFLADRAGLHETRPAAAPNELTGIRTAVTAAAPPSAPSGRVARIVPKGLRSFDEHDADFFLPLLPGPRDRDGLPDSLRFWKTRVEELDPDNTFSVGLIYGPSGCGKSSLVKAGLLPRLGPEVVAVYVEATPHDTEARLLHALAKRCPAAAESRSLKEALTTLRRHGISPGKKVLIVLDQFEQWLHGKTSVEASELVQSLRQCDGGRVQCIVMVRDDFWLAVSRFLRALEVRLVEGHNVALVDLFDLEHAHKVLAALGRAFFKLPEDPSETSPEQKEFLRQSVAGLAEEGKVVCVRLALFAEMMKAKPWTMAALKEVGGAKGVGLAFLEETFGSSLASPEHRYQQSAARAVLKELLPESGTDIKGQMKSYQALLEASGYARRPREFDDLIALLDSELRLITPADPEGKDEGGRIKDEVAYRQPSSDPSFTLHPLSFRYYQLTHDYLVPSLRAWLSRGQRQTRRGRAELQLEERAATWNSKPERRQLPTLWEYLNIVAFSGRGSKKWTDGQRRMMGAAGRLHALRSLCGTLLALALVAGIAAFRRQLHEGQEQARVHGLVDQLLVAKIDEVPRLAAALEGESRYGFPRLHAIADDAAQPPSDRLRAAFVLAVGDSAQARRLVDESLSADLRTVALVRDRIAPFANTLSDQLWKAILDDGATLASQLRSAALLAAADPVGERWPQVAPTVVNSLLSADTLYLDEWVELLRPAAGGLIPEMEIRFADASATPVDRANVARTLSRYADAPLLGELILAADGTQFAMLFPAVSRHREAVMETCRETLRGRGEALSDERLRRQRNAAIALLRLGQFDEVLPILSAASDPTVRTMLVLACRDFGVGMETLLEAYNAFREPIARQAILLAMESYPRREISPSAQQRAAELLDGLVRNGRHASERGAAESLMRRRGDGDQLREITAELAQQNGPSVDWLRDHDWWLSPRGHLMTVIRGPITFNAGSPASEWGHEKDETLEEITLDYTFGIGAHEVTLEQFQRFEKEAEFARDVTASPRCPANKVSLEAAMQYCRWLSEEEGIPEDQYCYPPRDAIRAQSVFLSDEERRKTGYRLPTEAEWECACRAGSTTRWFCGDNEQYLNAFAWFSSPEGRLQPVGERLPNAWGLFDTLGNVAEWCQPKSVQEDFVLRGGYYQEPAARLRSAHRYLQSTFGYSFTGFRIARTIAAPISQAAQ